MMCEFGFILKTTEFVASVSEGTLGNSGVLTVFPTSMTVSVNDIQLKGASCCVTDVICCNTIAGPAINGEIVRFEVKMPHPIAIRHVETLKDLRRNDSRRKMRRSWTRFGTMTFENIQDFQRRGSGDLIGKKRFSFALGLGIGH